jgi:uncharacterized membrane protein YfcA
VLGLVPAGLLVARVDPDPDLLRLGLGLATLVPVFLRPSKGRPSGRLRSTAVLGGWTSFLAVFVGSTGALVGAVLGRDLTDQRERVATHTGCLWLQHLAKVVVYGWAGFPILEHLPLIAALLVASAIGAIVGRTVLVRVSNTAIRAVFEILIVALGASIASGAAMNLWYRT